MGKVILWLIIVVFGILALYILLLSVSALLVNPKREYEKDSPYYRFLLYSATALCMKLLRIRVRLSGIENIPKTGRFLLVCNHRSKFDPILTWYVLRRYQLAFISKPENFKVPIFGRIIRRCLFMPIDRENPRKAVKTITRAAELLQTDRVSVAVYPEGTRSYDGTLLPFHNSTLKIAQKAQVPIVVMTVEGTQAIHKNYPLHRSAVRMKIIKTLPVSSFEKLRTAEIGDQIRALMESALSAGEF